MTSNEYKLARALVEAHVAPEVAPVVLESIDSWHAVVDQAQDLLERAPIADDEGYFTVRQIMRRWGCSDETVRRVIDRGDLPEFRASNGVRVPKSAVYAYEEQRTTVNAKPLPSSPAPRRLSVDEESTVQRYPWLAG